MDHAHQDLKNSDAPYAAQPATSRGRFVAEPPSASRTAFQRDRDRIIHSGAFRKLRNKTQVFIENEGDYYRTRLTHSLEVAQIARSLARALALNEDLAETVALAHDLGHTCFGHAGEWALDKAMRPFGGFSHNEQTFRILTQLERRYIQFDGLNLTWETLEGVVKHNGPVTGNVPATIAAFNARYDLELHSFAGAEAQVAALADDIAYNTHDIDDGYRAGFFAFDDLKALPLFGAVLAAVCAAYPAADPSRQMHETVRQVIGAMANDVLTTTRQNLDALQPRDVAAIRGARQPVVGFSPAMQGHVVVLREFLATRMYRHNKVNRACAKAERIVGDLFAVLMDKPACMPADWFDALRDHQNDDRFKARLIADYIAGMTDRFAVQEHRRLFSTETMI